MTQTRTSIVCGVDGSAGGAEAARVAATFAAALDGRLILVHAVDDPPPFPYGDARERELQRGRSVRAGERLLEDVAIGFDAELSVRLGDPVEALHDVCQQESADLLVVGSRGHHGLAAALLGGIAVRVASTASCPVAIVPPGAGERLVAPATPGGAIICGVDGSAESERGLSVAVALGERIGLEALPVFVDPAGSWNLAAPSATEILTGDPARELRERATCGDARLVVVGSRGRGPLRRALLGSVSAALAASAPVPVLVVPSDACVSAAGEPKPAASAAGRREPMSIANGH